MQLLVIWGGEFFRSGYFLTLPGMNDPRLLSFSGCGKFVGAVSSGQAASGNILPRSSAGTREASGRSSHFSHALAGPAIASRLFELVE